MNAHNSLNGTIDPELKAAHDETSGLLAAKVPDIVAISRMTQTVFFRTSHRNPNEVAASVGVLEKAHSIVKKANGTNGERIQGYIDELLGQMEKLVPLGE